MSEVSRPGQERDDGFKTEDIDIGKIKARDRKEWDKLIKAHLPGIRMVMKRMIADPVLREDTLQSFFLCVYERIIDKFNPAESSGKIGSWLLAVARYKALEAITREKRCQQRLIYENTLITNLYSPEHDKNDDFIAPHGGVDELNYQDPQQKTFSLDEQIDHRRFLETLESKLTPKEKELIRKTFESDGERQEDIGRLIGITHQSVSQRFGNLFFHIDRIRMWKPDERAGR